MPKFFTPYVNRPGRCITDPGSHYVDVFGEVVDKKTGEVKVDVVGSRDAYLATQEAKGLDVYGVLEQCGVDPIGDPAPLAQLINEDFVDYTSAPRTLQEAHALIKKGQTAFDQLPVEIKREFDGSAAAMMKSLQDGTIEKRLARFLPAKESEVKDVDQN